MVDDCLFCRIVAGAAPAERVYESDTAVVIRDLHPQAPVHLLVLPRDHVATLNEATPQLKVTLNSSCSA